MGKFIGQARLPYLWENFKSFIASKKYAGGTSDGGSAKKAASIPFGKVDSTSTATTFTATVEGITELKDGTCVYLMNGVVTSAAASTTPKCFTLNINGLGAKPVYYTTAAASYATTQFGVNYTMLFVYNTTRVSSGCWDIFYGYDSNTNTIGYQLRTNSSMLPAKFKTYRYRLLFTSPDGTHFVAANASTSTDANTAKTPTTEKIDPFGAIVYYGTTTAVNANANFGASYLWTQYTLNLGYSFNTDGAALTLTYPAPVYVKATPQTDGSAIIDATTPYVQALPSTEDGKIYIFLGLAYGATNIELRTEHPVYYYKDGAIRQWTNAAKPSYTASEIQNAVENLETSSASAYTSVVKGGNESNNTSYLQLDNTQAALKSSAASVSVSNSGVDISAGNSGYPNATVTINGAGVVPTTRKVNGKALSADVTLSASDVDALPSNTAIPTKVSDLTNDSGFTANTGTITGITMNGASKGTAGVVDLGTVLTEHQSLAGKQDVLTFDSTPTTSSTNPVTSGGVKTALDAKQNTLTFDSAPTASSTNPVTSGGVKTALDAKADAIALTSEATTRASADSTLSTQIGTKSDKVLEVNHGTSDTTFTLTPNVFHKWGEVTSLTLTLGTGTSGEMNEYMFQFYSGNTPTTLTLPNSVIWVQPLTTQAGKTYQVSIVNNLAVYITDGMAASESSGGTPTYATQSWVTSLIDNAPMANSSNVPSSGGTYDMIEGGYYYS